MSANDAMRLLGVEIYLKQQAAEEAEKKKADAIAEAQRLKMLKG